MQDHALAIKCCLLLKRLHPDLLSIALLAHGLQGVSQYPISTQKSTAISGLACSFPALSHTGH
jgi:hypothetical protein